MGVILLRHTRPRVAPGVCYGRTDLDLADSFEEEAAAVLRGLPAVDAIITSPLSRCRRLADLIALERGLTVTVDPRVREMDFGAWEGRRWADLPRAELDAWAADFYRARPHGGESVAMLHTRTQTAMSDLHAHPERALVVTHAGVVKAAFARGRTADDFSTEVDFGALVPIDGAVPV